MQKGQTQTGDEQEDPVTFATPELLFKMCSQKSNLPCSYATEGYG